MDRVPLLGVEIEPLSINDLHEIISETIDSRRRCVIANHNLHSVYIYHHDRLMREFYSKADVVHIDGMPIVLWGRILGYPLSRVHRVTYVDWIYPLAAEANKKGWRIFYLGSRPGVAEKGACVLRNKFNKLQIATQHGYFDMDVNGSENEAVLDLINGFQPHILMIGMGMPRQEYWILANMKRVRTNIIMNTGACMDYVAGVVPTPPRLTGQMGLEWMYRFLIEPSRLWKRYFIEPWFLATLMITDLFRKG